MDTLKDRTRKFRNHLKNLSREQLLDLIQTQSPKLYAQVQRIEWVFENKMSHLAWDDGTPITSRPLTNEELALLIDEPFEPYPEMTEVGISIAQQRQIHIAKDPILWGKEFLGIDPRVYQILLVRHPSLFKVLRLGRRAGKALDVDTPIPTPDGWKTMGELSAGDRVFDEEGKPCNVVSVTPYQYGRKCYEVIFSDGSKIVADEDHQWTVDTKAIRKGRARNKYKQLDSITLTTKAMLDSLYVTCGNKQEANYSIAVSNPVEYAEKDLPIDPYVLGVWLGDGTNGTGKIDTGDQEILNEIKLAGYELTSWKYSFSYNVVGLHGQLRSLNMLRKPGQVKGEYNKFVPKEYLQGSVRQREALLQGIMDTDGTINDRGAVEISLCDEVLASDVFELIQSLGYRCTIRKEPAKLYGRQTSWRYRMYFTPWRPVFRLSRKLEKQKLLSEPSLRIKYRYIVDIKEVESRPVKCIMVDSPNSLYLAGTNFIPTHNTFSMALVALHYAYTTNHGRVLVLTPMKPQGGLIYQEMMRFIEASDVVSQSVVRNVTSPQYEIELTNGSTIRFFSTGMKSGGRSDVTRGQEAHIIILDEMDYMGDEDLEAIFAMMQKTSENQPDKQMIGASTPSGKRGVFWRWCTDRTGDNVFREFWFPSYVNPHWDIKMEKFFRNEYTEMGYRHEVEADWGDNVDGVYPRRLVDLSFDYEYAYNPRPSGDPDVFYVMGVDWDKYGAGTNMVVLEVYPEDYPDKRMAGRAKVFYRVETAREEYTLIMAVERIIKMDEVFHFKHIYVDRGFGEVQVELLHKYGVEHPMSGLQEKVKGIQFSETIEVRDPFDQQMVKKEMKPFMVDNLRQFFEKQTLLMPRHDEPLYEQLISYVVARQTSTGRPVFEAPARIGDHAHDALILACLAITQNYGELMRIRVETEAVAVSNHLVLQTFETVNQSEEEYLEDKYGKISAAPVMMRRSGTQRRRTNKDFSRKSF